MKPFPCIQEFKELKEFNNYLAMEIIGGTFQSQQLWYLLDNNYIGFNFRTQETTDLLLTEEQFNGFVRTPTYFLLDVSKIIEDSPEEIQFMYKMSNDISDAIIHFFETYEIKYEEVN